VIEVVEVVEAVKEQQLTGRLDCFTSITWTTSTTSTPYISGFL
jgi:hypothetical protein